MYTKYEKPNLEEMDLNLEGSFLCSKSDDKVPINPDPGDGDNWD